LNFLRKILLQFMCSELSWNAIANIFFLLLLPRRVLDSLSLAPQLALPLLHRGCFLQEQGHLVCRLIGVTRGRDPSRKQGKDELFEPSPDPGCALRPEKAEASFSSGLPLHRYFFLLCRGNFQVQLPAGRPARAPRLDPDTLQCAMSTSDF
jgi:hypothetical protein